MKPKPANCAPRAVGYPGLRIYPRKARIVMYTEEQAKAFTIATVEVVFKMLARNSPERFVPYEDALKLVIESQSLAHADELIAMVLKHSEFLRELIVMKAASEADTAELPFTYV